MGNAQIVRLPILDDDADAPKAEGDQRGSLLDALLREQQDLTAVERFSQLHDAGEHDLQAEYYRSLLPASPPGPGEQYAFEVDLDRCTGCKACVTACHSLNGLDDAETWRSVGLLHGGTSTAPVQQTVTSACHHCLDPACMTGCPVKAYEKDPVTGIVRHLDDQCIGCQYCMFTCPYEVPQFNASKGIVRKCDMCSDRLAEGEAPACVQACPNEAIAIQVVRTDGVLEDAQAGQFLPGAPSPAITAPTTTYKSAKPLPRNMLPADFYAVHPAHEHMPLVIMLVLTQLSIGAFCVDQLLGGLVSSELLAGFRPLQAVVALTLGLLALGASTLHLGRPQYAFRAILGLRTSWMSREIVALGAFAGLAAAYAAALWIGTGPALVAEEPFASWPGLPRLAKNAAPALGVAVAIAGLFGVTCSVMLYHVTKKAWWAAPRTGFKFFLTTGVLGVATTTAVATFGTSASGWVLTPETATLVRGLSWALVCLTVCKLFGEATVFMHLDDKQHGDLKRSALLLSGELKRQTFGRFLGGALGGVLLPLLLQSIAVPGPSTPAVAASLLALVLLTAGELLERMTFFAAVSAPRMPGAWR